MVNGTVTMEVALKALNIGWGDEVIVPGLTFAATAYAPMAAGALPVVVDVEPKSWSIDAEAVEAAITPRTRAIIPVSLYGQVADMDALNAIAARHGLAVIEDAAQSFGATYRGRRSCALSTIGCTSFFPSKPLGCYGDGGALFTDDDALAQAAREIRVHGQSARYTHTRIGVGGRMDTLQCAIVLGKLPRFEWELQRRAALGARYTAALQGLPGLRTLTVMPDRDCVWGQYTVFVHDRTRVQAALKDAGIPTAVHYPKPLHHQPAYAAAHAGSIGQAPPLPVSEALCHQVMSLPMHPYLEEADVARVAAAVRAAA
jgi:UDP-2-acetamido-2-deoxy-ribo-hexuluronate aminotransferase